MEKILNFRDLGGIETANGKKIKKGLFFRCASLEEATANDVAELKNMGIKLVFDYRNPEEVPDAGGYPYNEIGAQRLSYTMLKGNNKLYRLQNQHNLRRMFAKVTIEDVKETYRVLPFDNDGYKRMVQALQNHEVPFIQHCSAGKDRTGVGTAILLGILGVNLDNIMLDYLASLQVENEIKKKLSERIPRIIFKLFLKRFGVLLRVEKELLEAALEEIIKRYGDLENYALNEFGLTREKIKELRNAYTE